MRLRTVLLALLVVGLAVSATHGNRPYYPNWPDECAGSTPVCFLEVDFGTSWFLDAGDEVVRAFSFFPVNNFLRENTDGSWYLHIVDNGADLAYVPPGAADPSEWYWSDPPLSGHATLIGDVFLDDFGLNIGCPFQGHYRGIVVDAVTGQRFKMSAMTISVPDTDEPSGCAWVINEIKLKPIKD